jgi:hypothetical protein
MDLEALLKEQAMMEKRLADLKRRREEEDEAFARSLQEEEERSFSQPFSQRLSQPFSAPLIQAPIKPSSLTSTSSSSQSSSWGSLQAKAAKSHQERMDEEMARLLAESEDNAFDLVQSPKNALQLQNDVSLPSQPIFSIFEKRLRTDPVPTSGSSSVRSTGASPGFNGSAGILPVDGLSAQTNASQSLQNHAQSILSKSFDLDGRGFVLFSLLGTYSSLLPLLHIFFISISSKLNCQEGGSN